MAGIFDNLAESISSNIGALAAPALGTTTAVKLNNVSSSMVFPLNLANYPFWMSFSFYTYRRPKLTGNPILTNQNTIRLPLPNQMMDHQDIVYTQEDAGLAAGVAINEFQNSSGSVSDLASAALKGVAINAGLNAIDVNRISNKGPNLLLQLGGVATNPFLTVMFKSPAFKKHQFTWRLSPTSVYESNMLSQIIRTLRYNQLPDTSGALGGALLTYPNIVQLNISNSGGLFDYRFKPAVIESLSVNFAPGGQPSFFGSTRAPTEVEIRLSLLEIEYYLQRDYGSSSTAGIATTDAIVGLLEKAAKNLNPVAAEAAVNSTITTGQNTTIDGIQYNYDGTQRIER